MVEGYATRTATASPTYWVCRLKGLWKITRPVSDLLDGSGGLRVEMELLTPKDVKKILRCSLPLVYRMAARGQLPCVRWECPGVGERKKTTLRFEVDALRDFIEKHRQNGEKST